MSRIAVVVSVVLMVAAVSVGAVPIGVGASSYARQALNARPAAMGGAFVAVAEGLATAHYNPAGLGREARYEAGGMYSLPYGEEFDTTLQHINLSGTLQLQSDSSVLSAIGWNIGWVGLSIGDIWLWDEEGEPRVVSASSSLYTASVGICLPSVDGLRVGASIKLYRDAILEGRSVGIGGDVGLLWDLWINETPLSIGINAMDIGETRVKWYGTEGDPDNYVYWVNKFGVSTQLLSGMLLLAADFDWTVGRPKNEQMIYAGIEIVPVSQLAIRGGCQGDLAGDSSSYTAGIGIYLAECFHLDYAYTTGRVFGEGHMISISYLF